MYEVITVHLSPLQLHERISLFLGNTKYIGMKDYDLYIANYQMVQKIVMHKEREHVKANGFKMLVSKFSYMGALYSIFINLELLPDEKLKRNQTF